MHCLLTANVRHFHIIHGPRAEKNEIFHELNSGHWLVMQEAFNKLRIIIPVTRQSQNFIRIVRSLRQKQVKLNISLNNVMIALSLVII